MKRNAFSITGEAPFHLARTVISILGALLVLIFLSGCAVSAASQPTPTITPLTLCRPIYDGDKPRDVPGLFYSSAVGDTYRIYLSLPAGYEPETAEGYPVVYLLDGDWYFDGSNPRIGGQGAMGIAAALSKQGLIPPVILVGIGYPQGSLRGRDFLWDYSRFYAFLTGELIPIVDERLNTSLAAGRTLIGHSDGGFFTFYAFSRSKQSSGDEPFSKFIAISGDFTKRSGSMFRREASLYDRIKADGVLNVSLYMAVGGREEERFVDSNREMAEMLGSRNYAGFKFKSMVYSSLNHGNVVRPAIWDGLKWVFG